MNYLIYIEHAAENLQFYLWYRDYVQRFSEVPENVQKLSPAWSQEQFDADIAAAKARPKAVPQDVAELLKGTDFANEKSVVGPTPFGNNPFSTPPQTADGGRPSGGDAGWSDDGSTLKTYGSRTAHNRVAAEAFEKADQLQPFTNQPFREEITRIIATYIAENSNRQLNLSSKEKIALLHALSNTTHPSAFSGVIATVEYSLRHQAHPNFIRWAICNGNPSRVVFAHIVGVSGILFGFLTMILITLSSVGRGWRAFGAIWLIIGLATLVAARKGMCVVLHGMHHRHLRPWELFWDDDEATLDSSSTASAGSINKGAKSVSISRDSLNSVYSNDSNSSWEDMPWVAKYEKRNVVRKVFDRQVWIEEPALRSIQDTIFLQSLLGATVFAGIMVAVFVSLPNGHYF